ncbi:MAG: CCA tRNA nucleotidyltransferase [Hyphomicrobiaceae bacterium]
MQQKIASSLAGAPWLEAKSTRAVLDALSATGHEARIVGGAVRDALLGRPVREIDVATDALPDEVERLAHEAGLVSHPTGLAHGTITVVAHGSPFEVTTLRRDIATDGRRAVVAFTRDWREDAERRDLTINAIYCDRHGALLDPVGGLDDLARRRVRFIGDARQRVREDYLRILRFFRFSATYADGPFDRVGLAACEAERSVLASLSAERIRSELLKLLAAPRAGEALDAMEASGILQAILGRQPDLASVQRMIAADRPEAVTDDGRRALVRLAALIGDKANLSSMANRLRLSNAEHDALAGILGAAASVADAPPEGQALRAHVYRHGPCTGADGLRLAFARSLAPTDDRDWQAAIAAARAARPARFPLKGSDLIAAGLPTGPRVGQLLRAIEDRWIAADFPTDDRWMKEAVLAAVDCSTPKSD